MNDFFGAKKEVKWRKDAHYSNSHIKPGENSRGLVTVVAGVVRRYMEDLEKMKWFHRNITKLGGLWSSGFGRC